MLKTLNNESKIKMRQNIKQHRQKLLQYLENTNDTILKPKIQLLTNDIVKSNLNHNVKSKIASSAKLLNRKLEPATKITNHKFRSAVRINKSKPDVNITRNNCEVLTDNDAKKHKTRSSVTMNQLKKPLPNIKIEDPKSPPSVIRKLKEEFINKEYYSSEIPENSDNVRYGDYLDECNPTHNKSDIHKNDNSNSSIIEDAKYHTNGKPANEEQHLYYSYESENSVLGINNSTTKARAKSYQTNPIFRFKQNALERKYRKKMSKHLVKLRETCSYLNSIGRTPSILSTLLAAKKECDLLKQFEEKIVKEKELWYRANEDLKHKLAKIQRTIN